MSSDAAIFAGARRPIVVPRGRQLFAEDDPVLALYRIERGCVRLQVNERNGARHILAFLFPGDVICAGLQKHWASAEAVCESVVLKAPTSALLQLMQTDPAAAAALLEASERTVSQLAHHVGRLFQDSAAARISWFLGWMAERAGADGVAEFEVPMDQRDIADFLGLAPETVSRVFAQLEAAGLLRRVSYRHFTYRRGAHEARLEAGETLSRRDGSRPCDEGFKPGD